MLRTAWVLARKDLTLYFRDRTALLLSLLLPVCLATIFGLAMGSMFGGGEGMGRVKLLVEDLDGTDTSRALVAALSGTKSLKIEVLAGSRKEVADGHAPAALVIPSGYSEDLRAGRTPQLKLFRDPSQAIEQQIIAGSLLPALVEGGGRDLARGMMRRGMSSFGVPESVIPQAEVMFDEMWSRARAEHTSETKTPAEHTSETKTPFNFGEDVPRLLGVETEDVAGGRDATQKTAGQAHAVSGIAVMMLLFSLTACGGTLLEEQSSGTLQRLQLTPSSGAVILAGKFVYTAIVGVIQLVLLFLFGGIVFAVPVFRDPIAVAVVSLSVAFAATGAGMLLAVLCRSRKQLEGLSTLIILVMSALGGSWFPLIATPEWYRRLGHFTLNAWAMDAYQGIFWYGKSLAELWQPVLVLCAIAFVCAFLASRGWRRRFEIA
jgi:ABC-2 type transport system permease protein